VFGFVDFVYRNVMRKGGFMRGEKKFRGKSEKSRKWVYGSLVIEHKHDGNIYYIVEFGLNVVNGEKIPLIRVIPETVGEYIGVNDVNGKEAYDGDIVEFEPTTIIRMKIVPSGEIVRGVIMRDKWNNTYIHSGYSDRDFHIENLESGKIIGNVADNPELVKGAVK
jgi:uncharacterized phage protein (TIGR01671 family)